MAAMTATMTSPVSYIGMTINVGNSRQIACGDRLIICDHDCVLGVGRIAEIVPEEGTKRHSRCPVCRSSKFEERKKLNPRYKCRNGHTFEDLLVGDSPCTNYIAHFSDFTPCTSIVSRTLLRSGCPRYIPQGAMQLFELGLITDKLRVEAPELWHILRESPADVG